MASIPPPNHITGRRSAGFRFRLNCRPISRLPLYLPLAMKNNVHIRQILDGVHPCDTFATSSIESAREYFNPDSPRGIDFRYVHFADMNKWKDRGGETGCRAYVAGISGVLPDFWTLIVLEGTRPPFYKWNADFKQLYDEKVKYAIKFPPFFVSELLYTRLHRNDSPFLTHIELS